MNMRKQNCVCYSNNNAINLMKNNKNVIYIMIKILNNVMQPKYKFIIFEKLGI